MMYVSQSTVLHTLYSAVCQSCLKKTGEKEKEQRGVHCGHDVMET